MMGSRRSFSAAIAALAAAVYLAAAPAAAPAEPTQLPERTWQPYKPAWDVAEVGSGERSLELLYEDNACAGGLRVRATVRETHSDVIVSLEGETPPTPLPVGGVTLCRPPHEVLLSVGLKHRLAGRMIRGREAHVLGEVRPGMFPSRDGGLEDVTVPNLIGFSPRDAAHALLIDALRPSWRRVRRHGGLPRAVAQARRPGSTLPRGTAVRISIAGE
jgi:hypothetical protein